MAAAFENLESGAMETRSATKVFIVEDSAPVRSFIVDFVARIEGASVVGEAETPRDAVEGILRTRPDCVVLDYQLKGGTGVDVLRAIHPGSPEIAFVVLSNHSSNQYRRACSEAGARWFFDKSMEFGKLKDAIDACKPLQG